MRAHDLSLEQQLERSIYWARVKNSAEAVSQKLSRFSRLNPDTGCIEWIGCKNKSGYGQGCFCNSTRLAHRVAWFIANGHPGDLLVLHRCDNRSCINVDHLFLGTQLDNSQDMIAKGRERHPRLVTCRAGLHALSGENLYISRNGKRRCLPCVRASSAEYYEANRQRIRAQKKQQYSESRKK